MSEEIQLIDLEHDHLPREVGTQFRVTSVLVCRVCHRRTNLVEVRPAHYHQRYADGVCVSVKEPWHRLLNAKLALLGQAHPASYKRELTEEIAELRKNGQPDDLLGSPSGPERSFPKSLRIRFVD